MVHKCAVGGCPNRSDTIIHYILPEDPKRRNVWIKFLEDSKSNGENVCSSNRVCGDHFSDESYCMLDVGYTTCKILSVDAVPTVYCVNPSPETENRIQNEQTGDTCTLTISETISLACVKEEPVEYDLNDTVTPQEPQNSSLDDSVKDEQRELAITEDMDVQESAEGKETKGKSGISDKTCEVKDVKVKISCLVCGQRFRSRRNLAKHRRARHAKQKNESVGKEKSFVCSVCGEMFPKMVLLMQHEALHTEKADQSFVCQQCEQSFADEALLKAHQKVHEDALPFSCNLCPRRFGYKVALAAHVKHHSWTSASICPVCDKTFPSKSVLIRHIKQSHAKNKLMCKVCNSSFPKVSGYIKHMDKHNVVTPYFCSVCKLYLTQRAYTIHMLGHEQKSELNAEEPENEAKRGIENQSSVPAQHNSSEEATPTVGSHSETETQEEPGTEMISDAEVNVPAEVEDDPSAVTSAVTSAVVSSAFEVVE